MGKSLGRKSLETNTATHPFAFQSLSPTLAFSIASLTNSSSFFTKHTLVATPF